MFIKYCLLLSSLLILGCDKYNAAEYAVINNDFEKFSKIVNSQEKEIINERGESLLHRAAFYGRTDMVKLLIDKGYSLNRPNVYGVTPLAYSYDNIDIAKLLVKNGAKINTEHWQPINTAIMNNEIEIVHYFLDNGADLHLKDRNGLYPIHYAVEDSGSNIVELLLPNYSLKDITEGLSGSVINRTLRRKNPQITKPVISKLREELAKSGEKVIFYAINSSNISLVRYLVENGEDMTVQNNFGKTPLEHAVGLAGENSEFVAAIKGESLEQHKSVVHRGDPPAKRDIDQPQMIFIFVPPRPTGYFTYSHCQVDLPGEAYSVHKEENGTQKIFKDVPNQLRRPLIAVFAISKQEETYKIDGRLEEQLQINFKLVDWKGTKAELVVKDTKSGEILPHNFTLEGDFSFAVTAIDHLKSNE